MKLKKPKFWDYKKPNIYAYLLYPIALLIKILNSVKAKLKSKEKTKIKTICVGNIYLGGTGKTSLTLKLNEIFNKKKIKTCLIKKFYKNQHDEQKILKNNGKLFLSNIRLNALKEAEKENYEIAIFDDGLQDLSIEYHVNLVCFNSINWVGNGMTIPSGPLREDLNSIKKYKNVIINGNLENSEEIKYQILKMDKNINVYEGIYKPLNLDEFSKNEKYLVFSGIGNHQTFISMINNYGLNIIKHMEFPDHYNYTQKDIDQIIDEANNLNCKIITTEKDYFRIDNKNINQIKFLISELEILEEDKMIENLLKDEKY